ncbi:MAG: glutamate synthase subunit beta [Planctomycetes bacterium]|nr:glutamate synthase subunit beta [Planctomycetota bacterium]
MADPRGFLTVPGRQEVRSRPVEVRLRDWKDVHDKLDEGQPWIKDQASRCMDCGVPFCQTGCPLGNIMPEFNDLVYRGQWDQAVERIHVTNNFPEFTGRVCPAPCESACVLGIHCPPVTIKSIEQAIADAEYDRGLMAPHIPERLTGATVAVVGSGPAGLAAAQQLTRAGHTVVVYERDDAVGGLLRYGIPDFKLEKEVLDRRIDLLEREGILFECGIAAGADLSGGFLLRRHGALLLACGARRGRDLDVPGRTLSGIHWATDFLAAQNRVIGGEIAATPKALSARGRRVVVIGGGDTGADCIGTAWRQGAASVVQLEILPEPPSERSAGNPWPEWPRVRRDSSSHAEGGIRRWNAATLAFLPRPDASDELGALQCAQAEWIATGDGRSAPSPRADTEWIEPADLVLLATGFAGVEPSPLYGEIGTVVEPRGVLARDRGGCCAPRVYAAGDGATGPSLVVRAIADGLAVAERMLEDLRART